ncbi:MAG: SDR family oxidoreductase [SAR324 cluster bacterium]|nr:SDR family oxidoreductase [SAR324 cluster bacterium]
MLTGATGYVGGRLLKKLELRGFRIRCMARNPEILIPRAGPSTQVVKGNVLDINSLKVALKGVSVAYYLVHSMGSEGSFEENDRKAAHNFGKIAKIAGVERIIYLGGLGNEEEDLSPHLSSRQEVGKILGQYSVPLLEFRASVVIGSGSLSFQLIRSLVERLPIMITPKWVQVSAQPIAIEDLIEYLEEALFLPDSGSRVYEIGGADQVSYADIMRIYGRCRNITVRMIPVPFLSPYISSLWLGLITPLYARIGRKLIQSIVHSTVVRDESALKVFNIKPMGVNDAIRRAIDKEDKAFSETRWSDSISSSGKMPSWPSECYGSRLIDSRTVQINMPPKVSFKPIQRIGGDTGWYAWNWLWKLRGFIDLLIGGVGMRRGRAHFEILKVGDTIDFWRVEEHDPNHLLRLTAEMKMPGRAWLEFEVLGDELSSTIRQTAIFDPVGLFGLVYWYALYPLHQLIFGGMLRGITNNALSSNTNTKK